MNDLNSKHTFKRKTNYDFFSFRNADLQKTVNFIERPETVSTRFVDIEEQIHPSLQKKQTEETSLHEKLDFQQQQLKMQFQYDSQPTFTSQQPMSVFDNNIYNDNAIVNRNITKDPEIKTPSVKQQLSQKLFNELQKEFSSFTFITESDVDFLLNKKSWDWSGNGIQNFVKELLEYNKKKQLFNEKISQLDEQYNNHTNYSDALNEIYEKDSEEIDLYISQSNHQNLNGNANKIIDDQNHLYKQLKEPVTLKKDKITLNSADRNTDKYKSPNCFQINIEKEINKNKYLIGDKKGVLFKNLHNITEIELESVIIPKYSNQEGYIDTYPYLILEVLELGKGNSGTNKHLENAFGKLIFDVDCGLYKMCTNKKITIKKTFEPPINLNSFTIHIKKPNGDFYDFGDSIVKTKQSITNHEASKENKDNDSLLEDKNENELLVENKKEPVIKPEICFDFIVTSQLKKINTLYPKF